MGHDPEKWEPVFGQDHARSKSAPMNEARKILVLGASGLIGRFVTGDLRARGFHVVGIARRFSPSQKTSALDLEMPLLSMDAASLAQLIGQHGIDLVVNCLGVLQDGPGSDTRAVHRDFVERLLQAIRNSGRAIRLVFDLSAKLGDLASWPGWMPPMRTTAITELRHGVTGDPHPWMAATVIVPRT